ncbi:MAG: phage portal protein [Pseudonocardiaceae bacterium]
MAESTDLTPLEWLARLGKALIDRQPRIEYWRRYYEGDQDLPAGPEQHREAFRRFQQLTRTNLCLLCAESMVHRLQVTGYRDNAGQRPDHEVWRLWQALKLDARQFAAYRKALSRSAAYVTVGVDPRDQQRPRVTIEGPENVIVETDPADASRRLAGLRLWHDSIAKRWMATLYLPGQRWHWQTVNEAKSADQQSLRLKWDPSAWETRADPGRSFAQVPVVPFLNGDEGECPVAEFNVGIDVQDRLNLTVLNRLSAERYAAFRQRYMTNYEVDEDPITGLPLAPFRPGTDQVWTVPPPEPGQPETRLGDFAQTDTSQMLRGVEADMRAFAAVTLTPVYYLPGDLVNIGADSVAALDAGHVAKVRQRMANFGEAWEEVLALMAQVAGITLDLSQGEVVWARPENTNPAQVADYASKLVAAQIPLPMVAEEIGWSPQRVDQLRAEIATNAFLTAAVEPPPAGQPGPVEPAAPGPGP